MVNHFYKKDILYTDLKYDHGQVQENIKLCTIISQCGDNEILFSDIVDKLGKVRIVKRHFILTDSSVYLMNEKNLEFRRVGLEEIGQVFYKESIDKEDSSSKKSEIVLRVASEYDIYIRLTSEYANEFKNILKELYEDMEFVRVENIKSVALVSKTEQCSLLLKNYEDPNFIVSQFQDIPKIKGKKK
jgi:hypothetical protein